MYWDRKFSNLVSLLFLGFALFLYFQFHTYPSPSSPLHIDNMAEDASPESIYDFSVKDIRGNDVSLSEYKGKVVLIVNVASKCGLTQSNYKELNVLYEKYKNQGFEILVFPCNQFGGQEPGTNNKFRKLHAQCSKQNFQFLTRSSYNQQCSLLNYKYSFPLYGSILSHTTYASNMVEVNGKNAAPLYRFLKSEKGGYFGDAIKWNFTKYAPTTSPLNIEKDIRDLLGSS
ncbi:hypothetical protein ES319_D08G086300v1 [Gossypium barbadense]|uniref:Glutathione peroxidase n=1 Tax=Gossypium barbadense TaxID=3634 RepID=A0A5J5QHN4_GOSBA|nr:hypothetical protein ES319_D08G086300v1 [Gossypium barbadense]